MTFINDVAEAMYEEMLQANVVALARALGFLAYHTNDSRRSAAGFPDLVLVKAPRLLLVELKRMGQDPTEKQEAWLEQLRQCEGPEIYVWRPMDWLSRDIERVLKGEAGRGKA